MTFLVGDDRQRLSHLLQRLAARDSVERGVLHLHPRKTDVSLRILVSACRAAARIDRPNEPRALRWLLREALPDQQSTEREADLELRLEMRRRELDDTRYLLDRGIVREQAAQQRAEQAEQRLAELQAALAALATAAEGGETSVTLRVREQQLEVLRSNQVIARVPR
jgi:hypothetical protein